MNSNVATFLSQNKQSHLHAPLFPWVKSTALLIARPTLAILFWTAIFCFASATHFEYRGTVIVLGCAGSALIMRGGAIPWRGLLCGILVYVALPLLASFDEVIHSTGYRLETALDLIMLPSSERITDWHVVAFFISFLIFLFWRRPQVGRTWPERYTWLAGAFFTDTKRIVASFQTSIRQLRDEGLSFGTLLLPSNWATKNFLLTGVIGSGKTTYLKKLMASALKSFRAGVDQRALIYDFKAEFYPFLLSLGLSVPIRIINPFDSRPVSVWWNLAEEITDEKTARQVAAALVPAEDPKHASRGSNFFVGKARNVLAGLMINFQRHSPGQWTFADVVLALRERKRYEAILRRDNDTATIVDSLEHGDTRGDVMATMDEYRWKYEVVAALWDRAQKNGHPSFTIKSWTKESEILLLTQDKSGGEILNPIYQALLRCVAEQISSQPNSDTRRTWMFLDEFHTLGRIPWSISEYLNTGRSKGASAAVTIQNISQMWEVYGEHEANTIVGALKCKAVFKSAPESAKWAQDVFGKAEYFVERTNHSFTISHGSSSGSSSTESTSTSREQLPLFRSEFFSYLKEPTPENGFAAGIFLDGYAYLGTEGFYEAIHSVPPPLDEPGYLAAPSDWQKLEDWNLDDLKRLRLHDLLADILGKETHLPTPNGKPSGRQADLPGLAKGDQSPSPTGKNGGPAIKIKR